MSWRFWHLLVFNFLINVRVHGTQLKLLASNTTIYTSFKFLAEIFISLSVSLFLKVHVLSVHNFAITFIASLISSPIRYCSQIAHKLFTNLYFKTFSFIITTAAFIVTHQPPTSLFSKLIFETKISLYSDC